MNSLIQFVYSPPGIDDPAPAIAASRAGSVGIFNAELHRNPAQVIAALDGLAKHARNAFGARLNAQMLKELGDSLVDRRASGLDWIIVNADALSDDSVHLQQYRDCGGRVLLECLDIPEHLDRLAASVDGLIARGRESLPEPTGVECLVLVAGLVAESELPVFAHGAVDLPQMAAAIVAGANGLVLAGQVSRLRECVACAADGDRPSSADSAIAQAWASQYQSVPAALSAVRQFIDHTFDSMLEAPLLAANSGFVASLPGVAQKALPYFQRIGFDEACLDEQLLTPDAGMALLTLEETPAVSGKSLAQLTAGIGERPWGLCVGGSNAVPDLSGLPAPVLVVVANGRVDQAMKFVRDGHAAFLRPAGPALVAACLSQGLRDFELVFDPGATDAPLAAFSKVVDALDAGLANNKQAAGVRLLITSLSESPALAAALCVLTARLQKRGVKIALCGMGPAARARKDIAARFAASKRVIAPKRRRAARAKPLDIAIVGIGCLLPRAANARTFWDNIVNRVNAITEIPAHRWDWRLYFDEDRTAEDKIYSRWGGFLDDLPFDPLRYGMPPNTIKSVDPLQLMTLDVVRQTLEDAGYDERPFDRDRVSVILGASGGAGDVGAQYAVRAETTRFAGELDPGVAARLPTWTEDSFAGILLNVAAGRAANRFDFGGVNFTVDAACASSLTAIYHAANELESGRSDMVIAGGVDTVQGPFGYLCFSKTQALSPRGQCSTFDTSADGIVISEGIAMVAMKRLADAERDGDRIYAVIKGVGGSSDGRARSMTAPHPDGQIKALQRAYDKAGYSPSTVSLFEAHGTGTVAGDTAEIETVTRLLGEAGAVPRQSVIGSVKTLIGHTKATAGVAGLIKTALAIYHGVQPPHANVTEPNARLADRNSPLALLNHARPWTSGETYRRRAGVSAFGFGGTNFHVTMEEYRGNFMPGHKPAAVDNWPSELLVFRAPDAAALAARIRAVAAAVSLADTDRLNLRDLAATLALQVEPEGVTATVVATSIVKLAARLELLAAHIQDANKVLPPLAYYTREPMALQGGVAVLFAGQGAQYPGMLHQLAVAFSDVQDTLSRADEVLADRIEHSAGSGTRLSHLIYPSNQFTQEDEKRAAATLTRTEIAQPALGAVEAGLWRLFQRFGLNVTMAGGHSYGEYVALHAAGSIDFDSLMHISEARGRYIVEAAEGNDLGAMVAVSAGRKTAQRIANESDDLLVANHNAPLQSILSGSRASIETALQSLSDSGVEARRLGVAAAFHSPFVAPATGRLATAIGDLPLQPPQFDVYSNTTAKPHSKDTKALRSTLATHLSAPVEFVTQVENMYDAGARIFLGLGPRNIQSSFVDQILSNKPHRVIRIDDMEGGLHGLMLGLACLLAEGVKLDLSHLFENRNCRQVNLEDISNLQRKDSYPRHYWLLNGSSARPAHEPPAQPLTRTEVEARTKVSEPKVSEPKLDEPIVRADLKSATPPPSGVPNREYKTMPLKDPTGPERHSPPPAPEPPTVIFDGSREAILSAHQDTMRKFLQSQENVMMAYLTGSARHTAAPVLTTPRAINHSRPASVQLPQVAQLQTPAPPPVATPAPAVAATSNVAAPPATNGAKPAAVNGNGASIRIEAPLAQVASMPPAAEPVNGNSALDAQSIKALLLDLVADRTGYPQDMLDLDQNIEADLGIDSIKRVEIVGALLKALPAGMLNGNEEITEQLNTQTTLQDMIDLLSYQTPQSEAASSPFNLAGAGQLDVSSASLPRFVMKALLENPAEIPGDALEAGVYLIVPDDGDLGVAVKAAIDEKGGTGVLLRDKALLEGDAGALSAHIDHLVQQTGPVRALLYLPGVTAGRMSGEASLEEWRRWTHRLDKGLFRVARALAGKHRKACRVLAASALGGSFGRGSSAGDGLTPQGGASGLLKSLNDEWPDSGPMKAVDLDPSLPSSDNAGFVLRELCLPGGRVEAGYPGGLRTVFVTEPAPLTDVGVPLRAPDADWVVFASGGARGITAEVLYDLAARGVHLVLAGRTPEPGPESPATAELSGVAELRAHYLSEARASGPKISPAIIEKRVNTLLRDREIASNLAEFRRLGARVEYVVCDMRDESQVSAMFDTLYARYGRLDGVVHGAGVIDDRLLADKSDESWSRVYDTKVDSTFLLARCLRPDTLKFVAFFTSVAGRYGNTGQTDYAAANEVVSSLARQLHCAWAAKVKVVAIHWGPWLGTRFGVGMVSPETRRKFESRGVALVPPDQGRELFTREITCGSLDDVEIVAGEGPWEQHERDIGTFRTAANDTDFAYPLLLDTQMRHGDNGEYIFRRTISTQQDRYLRQHMIDGMPVLPAAIALELMAEAAATAWPTLSVNEIQDLRAFSGIVLDEDSRDVDIVAVQKSNGTGIEAQVEIRPIDGGRPHYRCTVFLAEAPLDSVPYQSMLQPAAATLTVRDAYRQLLFHGPCFQTITRFIGLDQRGCLVETRPSEPAEWLTDVPPGNNWLFDPGLVDSAPQMALVWAYATGSESALPSRFGRVRRLGAGPLGPCRMHFLLYPDLAAHQVRADVAFVDAGGNLRLFIEALECTSSTALNRLGGGWKGEICV